MKGLIMIPYSYVEGFNTGVNIGKTSKQLNTYLKNCCVACISARKNNDENTDVALVTNINVPNPYNQLLTRNGVKIMRAEFDRFLFENKYTWALAFYKLCALSHIVEEQNYDYYAYLDSDVYVQSDFNNIWKECDSNILMYDICHGLQVEHYRHFLQEVNTYNNLNSNNLPLGGGNNITHYGGEFFAAKRNEAITFIRKCESIYKEMQNHRFQTTHGDEFIISLAATECNVKNAGAYIYRFWTGAFRLISTCYKYNPVTIIHAPAEKEYGILTIYNRYIQYGKLPNKKKAYRLLHLQHRSLRTIAIQLINKLRS